MSARRGRAQANGSDHINAHAASRFLRALSCPPRRAFAAPSARRRLSSRRDSPRSSSPRAWSPWSPASSRCASFGPRYRVGRLLAATPRVSVAEAVAIARDGPPRYVRVDGRIDAEDEFEDADHRPLVFRRTRLEARIGTRLVGRSRTRSSPSRSRSARASTRSASTPTRWTPGSSSCPRESVGVAGDLADRAPGRTRTRRRRSGP